MQALNVSQLKNPIFLEKRINDFYSGDGGFIYKNRVGRNFKDNDIKLVSNSYLSLSDHEKIIDAQCSAVKQMAKETLSSPLCMNEDHPQRVLEERLSEFIGTEDVAICQSGWSANYGLLKHIAGPDVPVYLDRLAHSSLWEGAKASGAKCRPFRHNDIEHLEKLILRYGSGVVAVDAIYSTNGDICPLEPLVDLVEKTGCVLVVDEAHSFGVYDDHGAGLVAELGLVNRVHYITASLAKAFACRGGLVAGNRRSCEFFRYTSEPFLFSSKVLTQEIMAMGATLSVVKKEGWRRIRLKRNAYFLRKGLASLGYKVSVDDAHIIALVGGEFKQTLRLRDALESHGVIGATFAQPATPKNGTLIRLAVTCYLTEEQIDRVVHVCDEIRNVIDVTGTLDPLKTASI